MINFKLFPLYLQKTYSRVNQGKGTITVFIEPIYEILPFNISWYDLRLK